MDINEVRERHPSDFRRLYEDWASQGGDALDDWWHGVYECATEEGKLHGFDIEDIHFSGFWSQGDGASWVGCVHIPEFLHAQKAVDETRWHLLLELIREDFMDPVYAITTSGSSVHERSMRLAGADTYMVDFDLTLARGPYAGATCQTLYDAMGGDATLDELDTWILEEARYFAQHIYELLEAEYEYLTSEEAFIQRALCNDVCYDVDEDDNIVAC